MRERHVTLTPGQNGMATLSARLSAIEARRIARALSLEAERRRAACRFRAICQRRLPVTCGATKKARTRILTKLSDSSARFYLARATHRGATASVPDPGSDA